MFIHTGLLISVPFYTLGFAYMGLWVTGSIFIFHIAVVPLVFKYSPTFRRHLVFANCIQWPLRVDFGAPASVGLRGARNYTVRFHSRVDDRPITLGVWHILPQSSYEQLKDKLQSASEEQLQQIMEDELATTDKPIVLYCHGNSNSRAASHRVELYQLLQSMDYHTVAFDYRGYGDSSPARPTEPAVVEDALRVYAALCDLRRGGQRGGQDGGQSRGQDGGYGRAQDGGQSRGQDGGQSRGQDGGYGRAQDGGQSRGQDGGQGKIVVWGHSLGTGISSHLLGNLDRLSLDYLGGLTPPPRALILEAPFNNMADEVALHPLATLIQWLPYFSSAVVAPFQDSPTSSFRSDAHLSRATALPVLILHARDDRIVPHRVGLELYHSILASRRAGDAAVAMKSYDCSLRLGHKWLCRAANLSAVVKDFVENCDKRCD